MAMNWIRRTAGLAAVLILAITAAACTHTPPPREPSPGVAVWKVQDADTTVYLFGTVHILRKNLEWQSPTFKQAWNESGTLYLEADTSPAAQARVQQIIPELGFNPPGVTLDSYLTEQGKADLRTVCASVNLPVQTLQPLRPWLASLFISVQFIVAQGGDPQAGVETILTGLANERSMPMRYFETAEQQLRLLASPSDADSAKSLETGLEQLKENPDVFSGIINAWKTGDAEQMNALINEGVDMNSETYRTLFVDRNKAWALEIDRVMDEEQGTYFVAVGAGHLFGPDAVQVFLRNYGHRAERM